MLAGEEWYRQDFVIDAVDGHKEFFENLYFFITGKEHDRDWFFWIYEMLGW